MDSNSYKKTKLENGLRIITVPVKNANSIAVLVLVGTGSKYETKDINGISHFLEHMFFKGTQKRPNTIDIAGTLDRVGGEYNAFTSKEVTGFWAKVEKSKADVALDWLSDMFLNSKFDPEEIEREKGVIIEEVNMYLDTPTSYIFDLWEELLYGDQPAGWKVIGEKENIKSFNREKILNYYKSHYSPSNTIICVAGDIDSLEMEERVKKYFKIEGGSGAPEKLKVNERQNSPQILLHNKKTDQTHFCLGVRAYDLFSPKRHALNVLSVILGGNMSSRLFINVRERNGLAYSIHTYADNATDSGYLVTQVGTDHQKLEKAVEIILKEYKELKDAKISDDELRKAKDYIKGSMALSLDASDAKTSFYAMQELLENRTLTIEEKVEKIEAVTVEDIQSIAREIFVPARLNLAVIGPMEESEKEKLEKLLTI